MNKTALVTGAGGAIGGALVEHLWAQGYKIKALARQSPTPIRFPEGVEVIEGDITDWRVMGQAAMDVSKIFHLAALLHLNNPSPEMRAEYQRINVEGTRVVVEAARDTCAERLVFFSTISVYGASERGEVFDEESVLCPDSFYAESKIEGERIVLEDAKAVVLRVAAVYGPRMKGNYPRLLRALERGRLLMIGDGHNRRTLVHVNDLCRAAQCAAERAEAAGQIFNVTDGRIHTLKEILDAMSAALGKSPPRFSVATRTTRILAGFLEDALRVAGKSSPVNRALIDKFVEDVAVSGEKIQRQLGYDPVYDLVAGWRETVKQMKTALK
jgi:UDP-glucose 4-epimerase